MERIDGKQIAQGIYENLRALPRPARFLAIIDTSDSPASRAFIAAKERAGADLGVEVRKFAVEPETDLIVARVAELSREPSCGGIVVQLPLPDGVDRSQVLTAIVSGKDVDAVGADAGRTLAPAVRAALAVIASCTGLTGPELDGWLSGKILAIVGARGFLVGAPASAYFSSKVLEVMEIEKGDDIEMLSRADIIISGAGVPDLITPAILKDGALVIDFGYGMKNGKPAGDFNPSGEGNFSYTPVPGGTGPILVAALFENFYKLNA